MSGDKRSVATDALEVLGTIITDKQVGRDAIHLACEPVTAGEAIVPGQDISVKDGVAWTSGKWVGIADPFIEMTIQKGARFLCVIYPRKITSLRHVWSHPDFPDHSAEMRGSPEWGRKMMAEWIATATHRDDDDDYSYFGDLQGASPEDLIEAMKAGDYFSSGNYEGGVPNELWTYFEAITGESADKYRDKGFYFSCSC